MIMSVKKITFAAVAAAALSAAGGVALANSSDDSSVSPAPAPAVTSAVVVKEFAAFSRPALASDDAGRQALKQAFSHTTPDEALFSADLSLARPAQITGSTLRAWVFPAGDKVCAALPDPRGGYGASCATTEQIASGHAFVAIGDPDSHTVTVAAIVADGAPTATVESVAGKASGEIAPANNIEAAVVSDTAKVQVGDATIDTSRLRPPAKNVDIGN
jgi:hypothetical protein